jgi:choline dehydrogenase-like flavoprotein
VNADPRFRDGNFLRGYYLAGDSKQELYGHAFGLRGFGRELRRQVNREIPYNFGIYAQGECLPRFENYVKLDPHKTDAWGIPALHIHASYGENEHAMARAMHIRLSEILDAVKVEELQAPSAELSLFGKNIHECGTARMGADPKKSVVNRFNQVHDAKNVFVTDGACFVTQGCYEPTLTIMAISLRAAEHLAAEFQRGNL